MRTSKTGIAVTLTGRYGDEMAVVCAGTRALRNAGKDYLVADYQREALVEGWDYEGAMEVTMEWFDALIVPYVPRKRRRKTPSR